MWILIENLPEQITEGDLDGLFGRLGPLGFDQPDAQRRSLVHLWQCARPNGSIFYLRRALLSVNAETATHILHLDGFFLLGKVVRVRRAKRHDFVGLDRNQG